jgi:hypothetical protein
MRCTRAGTGPISMRKPGRSLLESIAATLAALACPVGSTAVGGSLPTVQAYAVTTTGPDLSSWRADGRPSSVRGRDGAVTHVTPLRGNALTVQAAGVTPRWCGARLQTGKAPAQSIVLVGVGITEALSCTGIKAFGVVPAPRGVERVAFVYSGSSPNASGVTTVVIVDRISASSNAGWVVNDELSYKLDQRGNLTNLPLIRAYLANENHRSR